ncbi:spermatid-specific manchette-related protein 1 isoform X4 [Ornithorhynchus anatinus]|uniref:spermatid-specific manchette-related protein 1 isoform X4 n=1 Tax=Ornithorhynchus anatinus TaxID=9258 RepID=UPI0019D445EA|nr:spermatid-specific manchette-related protein 1 isoform X4 [Ornithorhynchus anatinus]
MFLFAHKTKTPTSTYTDSYRVPSSIKQSYEEPPLKAWEENKFVTQGLTQIATKKPVEQRLLEGMTQRAPNQFASQPPIPSSAYLPHKYWISEAEERFNPVLENGDRYAMWRTGPDNSVGWNRYSSHLPPLPKWQEAGRETVFRPTAPDYPPKSERQNDYAPGEREAVVNMIDTLSRSQLPSIQVPQHVPGRLPFQGYGSRCTGRHYCLRGMDYFVDGPPPSRRPLGQQTECPPIQPQVKDTLCCLNPPSIILPLCQP